jgi:hypothetical protein
LANTSETVQVDLCIAGGFSAMGFMVIFVLCGWEESEFRFRL